MTEATDTPAVDMQAAIAAGVQAELDRRDAAAKEANEKLEAEQAEARRVADEAAAVAADEAAKKAAAAHADRMGLLTAGIDGMESKLGELFKLLTGHVAQAELVFEHAGKVEHLVQHTHLLLDETIAWAKRL